MDERTPREAIKIWRAPELENIELMRATYVSQRFAKHSHDCFAVGVIERGALGFYYRGANVVAPAGAVNLANPDEPHTGQAAMDAGWTYRMFYMDTASLQKAAAEISGRPADLPYFQTGVIHDPTLASAIQAAHLCLEDRRSPALEKESRFLNMLTGLILRHADASPRLSAVGGEPQAVRLAREYLEECYAEDVSIERLARAARLSPFHFIRVFREKMGIPPHAYLLQVRLRRARDLLKTGLPPADTAALTGFYDQSHLTRNFKRVFGITPGKFSNFIQDP